jgi:hypothetical protein
VRTLILTYPTEIDDEAPLEGKFLQLRWASRAYLLFASADEHRYHNPILGRFLSEQGIPHHSEGAENLVVDHPELSIKGAASTGAWGTCTQPNVAAASVRLCATVDAVTVPIRRGQLLTRNRSASTNSR